MFCDVMQVVSKPKSSNIAYVKSNQQYVLMNQTREDFQYLQFACVWYRFAFWHDLVARTRPSFRVVPAMVYVSWPISVRWCAHAQAIAGGDIPEARRGTFTIHGGLQFVSPFTTTSLQ